MHLWFGNAYDFDDGSLRADVQVGGFVQWNQANGLGLDLGEFVPEVGFYGVCGGMGDATDGVHLIHWLRSH